jgi:predicted RNase H-like HicB family nuclease
MKHPVLIYWSEEDNSFLASAIGLLGCVSHGDTYQEALSEALDASRIWIETAHDLGRVIPYPWRDAVSLI